MDEPIAEFLASGCALIVATASPDGAPRASRGWGASVVGDERSRIRLLVDAADTDTLAQLGEGDRVAVTGADVRTLRSIQVKGRASGLSPVTDDDVTRHLSYCEAFFTAVQESDGTPPAKMARLKPASMLACEIDVDELYDQTPGPRAGGALPSDSS